MTRREVEEILSHLLLPAADTYEVPSEQGWRTLESRFGTRFPQDFVNFVEAMTSFDFPGELYNVSSGLRTNGNDTIVTVYDMEVADPAWPRWLIPFYGIGNGDYFALDARAGDSSPVLYWYHERKRAEKYSESFAEWVKQLPAFLQEEDSQGTPDPE